MEDVLNCKRCGGKILVTGYCSQCGLKSEYVNKALNTSKYYYNIGLDKARVRDMSGAVEALKTSLKYDKMNIDARNLLGLVYYETGEVVEALSHWVISVNYFDGRNVAKRYIKEVRSNPHKLETTNNVARKYNQALNYARQGSKDLAFIQLRKVLSENTKFINGYLLLALLFIDEGSYAKARKALKRVIKIDRTNPLAVRYFNEMGHTDEEIMAFRDYPEDDYDADLLFVEDQPRAYTEPDNVDFDGEPVPVGKYKDINFYKYSLAYVFAGLVLGLAVMWFLVIPQHDKNVDDDNRELKIAYSEEIANKNTRLKTLEEELESMTSKAEELEKQVAEYEEAKKAELSDDDKVSMQLALKYFQDTQYDKAIEELDKVLETSPDYDGALYYKALCYQGMEDEDKAEAAFKQFIEKCPDSIYYTVAVELSKGNADEADDTSEEADISGQDEFDDDTTAQDTSEADQPDVLNE
jgi:Tfp pilus assembly protein PilF